MFDCECGGRVFKYGAVDVNPPKDNVQITLHASANEDGSDPIPIDVANFMHEFNFITPEEYREIARQHIRKNLRPQDNILDYSKPMPMAELQQKLRELS